MAGRDRAAIALATLAFLGVGCSVRIPPSAPPVPTATAPASPSLPLVEPSPTSIPAPTIDWQMADLGDLGGRLFAFTDVAIAGDGLVALGVVQDRPAGSNLRLVASRDGIAWRLIDWPDDANIRSMAASDGVVWAFGRQPPQALETSVWRTEDGEAWEAIEGMTGHDVGVGRVMDLVARDGGSALMLVHRAPNPESYSSVVLRTDDGVTWADVPPARDVSWGLHTLTGDERGYVVTYTDGASGPAGIDEAWFSPDGVEWTAHELPGVGGASQLDSAAAHGRYVVGGGTAGEGTVPAIWSSTDGRSWSQTLLEDEGTGSVATVVPTADGFVALGWMADGDLQRTRSWWSADGASWFPAGDLPPLGYALAAVEWDGRLIAVGGLNGEAGSVSPAIWVGEPRR